MAVRERLARVGWTRGRPVVVMILVWSLGLFALVTRNSSFLDIDSGPYLSLAHHLASEGRPVSSFNFVDNFQRLPCPPNFIPPGLGLALAPFMLLTGGDPVAAGKVLLAICLVLTQLFGYCLLARRTGEGPFAFTASLLLVTNVTLATWAALLLTELPFVACLLAAALAATAVLEGEESRTRWGALAAASALLPLLRYLGVFFAPLFSAVYLARALRREEGRRGALRRAVFRLSVFNLVAFAPLAAWFATIRLGGSPISPRRPPSPLTVGGTLTDAGGDLLTWLGPWLVAGLVLMTWSRLRGGRPLEGTGRPGAADLFVALCLVGYLAVLIAARTRQAYYPLDELGYRYMVPAWPLAFLAAALAFHRYVWRGAGRVVRLATALTALAALVWYGRDLTDLHFPPPYPAGTETFQTALELTGPEAGILTNFGQAFVLPRPQARVVGIPSRQDFVYSLDLDAAVRRHRLEWLVLFAHPQGREMYAGWYQRWLAAPPREVSVTGSWRLADGVIYRLATPGAETGE